MNAALVPRTVRPDDAAPLEAPSAEPEHAAPAELSRPVQPTDEASIAAPAPGGLTEAAPEQAPLPVSASPEPIRAEAATIELIEVSPIEQPRIRPTDSASAIGPTERVVAREQLFPAPPDSGGSEESLAQETPGSSRGDAPSSASPGEVVALARADYLTHLRSLFERNKEYPRRARRRGHSGTVVVHVVIGRDGRLKEHRVKTSSGHRTLDRGALEIIRRAEPFPALPDALDSPDFEVTVPIRFQLR